MRYLLYSLILVSAPTLAQVNTCVENGVKVFRSGTCEGVQLRKHYSVQVGQAPAPQAPPHGEWRGPGRDPQAWRNWQTLDVGKMTLAELQTARAHATNEGDWSSIMTLNSTIRERLAESGVYLPPRQKTVFTCNTVGAMATCY